jgi:putative nucleotidyltransferase with HDIG domain
MAAKGKSLGAGQRAPGLYQFQQAAVGGVNNKHAGMIKKINVSQLKPGMYIHDLNCSWLDHPFLRNSFPVKSDREIKAIVDHGIREVYIDSRKGLDVADAPTEEEVLADLDNRLTKVAAASGSGIRHAPLGEELPKARRVFNEANRIVTHLLQDVRLGKQVDTEKADHVVEEMTHSIFRNKDALLSLSRIKQKDNYTFQHSVSVCALLLAFCRSLDMDRDTTKLVGMGGLLHDIGKMKVPDRVLNKPGKLSEDEFALMKSHVIHGQEILKGTPGISAISLDIAAQHHERHDGSGYPAGLKGDGISLYGRMASIVDVYDALTSDRCYHKGMEPTDALRKIFEWSRFHFDEQLVHSFVRSVGIYPVGTLVRLESGLLAVVVEQHEKDLLRPVVRTVYDAKQQRGIAPRDIDLSKGPEKDRGDAILTNEDPRKWGIDTFRYL